MNRLTSLAARLAVAAALAIGCGSSSAPSKLSATISVENGKPKGGVQDLKVKKGGSVHLVVKSDLPTWSRTTSRCSSTRGRRPRT